ncbi:hypothetical protein HAX54_013388 [Datura stramonium]|uniref:DUF4283 domain-containing protein n=1 Tax=Datura stramonium TaxID=4076 RepID=A0ABS8Y5Z3_DATST|nr:hypothetical protein [Datura stramonium]
MALSNGEPIPIHDQQKFPPIQSKNPKDPNTPSYASTINTAANPQAIGPKQAKEKVTTRQSTHNGIRVVIFKAKDYYGVMDEDIESPLTIDTDTNGRTKPSMVRVRVEVNLLKKLPYSIWVGIEDENSPLKGYAQKIEYEAMLKYCVHCKKMGHNIMNCRVFERKRAMEKEITENEQIEESSNNIKEDDMFGWKDESNGREKER